MSGIEAGQWLRYWRNSLADAESGSGVLKRDELEKLQRVPVNVFREGSLQGESVALDNLFNGVAENVHVVKIAFRPTAYLLKQENEHGKKRHTGFPDVLTPVICMLWVGRNGQFLPAAQPQIPRDLLSPQFDDELALASVAESDRFLDNKAVRIFSEEEAQALFSRDNKEEISCWEPYSQCARLLFKICQLDSVKKNYSNQEYGYFSKIDEDAGGTQQILKLYDWLANQNIALPLIENYALSIPQPPLVCSNALSNITLRLGHSNSRFPLAVAQRDALAQTLAMQPGEILAVNGPPGTGKTTFVLSVVASLWVEAARKEEQPPLIIAASVNNQAVTNIIAAFGKDFEENDATFSGRWLPEITSYGGYFPAFSLESEAAGQYQTAAFYRSLENDDYLDRAESEFLRRAKAAFLDENLNSIVSIKDRLRHEIEASYQAIENVQQAWRQRVISKAQCEELVGVDPEARVAELRSQLSALNTQVGQVEKNLHQWRQFCANEPLLLSLLNVIPVIARKRRLKAALFIQEHFCEAAQTAVATLDNDAVETALNQWLQQQQPVITALNEQISQSDELLQRALKSESVWLGAIAPYVAAKEASTLTSVDSALDITVRFRLFQLAVHYWEARWMLDYRQHEKDYLLKTAKGNDRVSLKAVRARWSRRMCLTPCIVSTLHSLPGHMTHRVSEGNDVYRTEYLTNEIDLLIIDEAGQVAPDVAGASFALAKRALVIGDVHQIKPVPNQTATIDIGNMLQQGLLSQRDDYDQLSFSGRSVVDGSVMRIAQQASRYHYLAEAEPGMFLKEHRRCFNEIISFCNDLCYRSLLEPKRGSITAEEKRPPLPALGYLHIDGFVESPPGGSRINRLEAVTIASWLKAKRAELEAFYDAKLEDIVGVVTPFKAQERQITEACKEKGIVVGRAEGKMTIGTVHALQGAERKIVLFSAVYSRHNDGGFIDRDESMLNVAVSRAKDSFLVFGDMDVIASAARGTPRHLLGEYLFRDEESELVFRIAPRPDLLDRCREPKVINNAEQHDECLAEILALAEKRVDIVSPWLSIYWLERSGMLAKMRAAVERDITVNLYTDYRFNAFSNNCYDDQKDQRFVTCCEQLSAQGIGVTVVNQVHSKLLIADECFICIGSFNWASAQREGEYKNMETSMLYSGDLKDEIQVQLSSLRHRIRREYLAKAIA